MKKVFRVVSCDLQSYDHQLVVLENEVGTINVHLKQGCHLDKNDLPSEITLGKLFELAKAKSVFITVSVAAQSWDHQLVTLENESARIEMNLKADYFIPPDTTGEFDFTDKAGSSKASGAGMKVSKKKSAKAKVKKKSASKKSKPAVPQTPAPESSETKTAAG